MQHSSEVAGFIQRHGAHSLYPLDDFLADPTRAAVLSNLPPELVADNTFNGATYALPGGYVTRANSLFYNKQLFAANELNPPTSVDEFLSVCKKFKAAGVNCVTTTFMTLLFEDLLAGVMGIDAYDAYRRGSPPDEAALRKGIEVFGEVIDNYLDPAAIRPIDGTQDLEVTAFRNGQVAMYAIGDWTKPGLEQTGWVAGVEFNIIAAPGNAGLFVYGADVYTIPAGAPFIEGALSFLATATTVEGQLALMGPDATPCRNDVHLNADAVRQTIIADWRQAKHRLAANTKFVWEGALRTFVNATPHDKDALLQVLLTSH